MIWIAKQMDSTRIQATGAAEGLQSLQPHLAAWAAALSRLPAGDAAAFAGPLLCAPASGLLVQVPTAAVPAAESWAVHPALPRALCSTCDASCYRHVLKGV